MATTILNRLLGLTNGASIALSAFNAQAGATLDRVMKNGNMMVATSGKWPPQAFLNDKDECLFIQRANTGHRDGQYSLVAGHLEPGESIDACAIRESKEEAGVIIAPGALDFTSVKDNVTC